MTTPSYNFLVLSFSLDNIQIMFQVWIYGNSYKSFLVAFVNPNLEYLKQWAQVNEVTVDVNALCEDPRARNYVLGELTSIGEKEKVNTDLMLYSFLVD